MGQRHDLKLYLRWLQDVRRSKPSTVSRLSVVPGFYMTCVIDGVLEHSPADYVRRPSVPPESPAFGLTHLMQQADRSGAPRVTRPRHAVTSPIRMSSRSHDWPEQHCDLIELTLLQATPLDELPSLTGREEEVQRRYDRRKVGAVTSDSRVCDRCVAEGM